MCDFTEQVCWVCWWGVFHTKCSLFVLLIRLLYFTVWYMFVAYCRCLSQPLPLPPHQKIVSSHWCGTIFCSVLFRFVSYPYYFVFVFMMCLWLSADVDNIRNVIAFFPFFFITNLCVHLLRTTDVCLNHIRCHLTGKSHPTTGVLQCSVMCRFVSHHYFILLLNIYLELLPSLSTSVTVTFCRCRQHP